MPIAPASTSDLPLPVRIFRTAMERQLSLADYAQSLGISAEDLRATVTARPDQVEAAVLDQLADAYNQPRETLRDQLPVAPPQESFGAWLKRNMDGISQHALRARVQVDARTLRQFLNAGLLPDSDQAERISRALYIDRTEIARVVAANMVQQGEADRPAATTAAENHRAAPASEEPAAPASRRTRRPSAASRADHPGEGGAAATEDAAAEPVSEGERVQRPASRRQVEAKTVDAAGEPLNEPEGDKPKRPAARRRASSAAVVPATPPESSPSPAPVPTAEVEQPTPTTLESSLSLAPAPVVEVEQPVLPAARRQNGATVADKETTFAHAADATGQSDNPSLAAAASEEIAAADAPVQPTARKRRRAGLVAKQDATDAAAPGMIPDVVETPAGEVAAEREPTPAVVPSMPVAVAQPSELAAQRDESSPASDATPAPVTAVLATDATTLQLTADEVRLIRHWRRLHPHGRRATLHYIGSLLVDD